MGFKSIDDFRSKIKRIIVSEDEIKADTRRTNASPLDLIPAARRFLFVCLKGKTIIEFF